MDFLPLPKDPTFPTPETPFLSSQNWDFGPFRGFLDRKYQDLGLTNAPQLPTTHALLTLPLQRIFDAVPAAKLQSFVQTWLFFGLLAEFLSLNELEDGTRLVSLDQAREEMAELYREFSTTGDDGQKLLTAAPILGKADMFVERVKLAGELAPRFHYLHACLTRSVQVVNNTFNQLDYAIRYSVAGLGELFMTNIYASSHLVTPRIVLPTSSFNWFRDYLRAGNDVEKHMLSVGWCPSEVEKLRNLFQGVASLHYVTRLRPRTRPGDHVRCANYACRAFQIDIEQYKPRHAMEGCQCDDVHVDEAELVRALRGTTSYPVLKIDIGPDGAGPANVTLETYRPGVNYVALSHVWADGLGNPRINALPHCQVMRIAKAVAELNRTMNESKDDPETEYRVWVDTICCPVELEGKAIALERIADVYKNSTHVLILDSSLTCMDTTTSDLAEMLLRTFSCSAWMRRLWTLQEAILPKNLCIQFQDKAASAADLMRDLYIEGIKDMRRLRIWHDLLNEFNYLQNFEQASRGLDDSYHRPQLVVLQRAIHFRTVSVSSDEPLCIAVLMNLQIEGLTLMTDGQERMARVWAALAETLCGISTSVVFYLEETLSLKGWRWAPKSLLGSLGEDSTLGMDERSLRFSVPLPVTPQSVGMPTPRGFRMRAQGGLLRVAPLRENFSVLPWKGVTKRSIEAHVLIHREATDDWYRIADWHRSRKLGTWTEEERKAYDEAHPTPMFDCIRSDSAALVFNKFDVDAEVNVAILGKAQECADDGDEEEEEGGEGQQRAMLFERERTVMCWRLGEQEVALLNKVIVIANRLADDQVTANLLACGEEAGPERDNCLAEVRSWLEKTVDREWKQDPEFAQLVASAGKSTLAKTVIAKLPNFVRFSVDKIIRDKYGLYGIDFARDKYSGYLDEAQAQIKTELAALLREGTRDAVLDLSFWNRAYRDEYKAIIEKAGGRWVLVFLDAGKELLWSRIQGRRTARDRIPVESGARDGDSAYDIEPETFEMYWNGFEPPNGEEEIRYVVT
ncbi:HET domain protein [Cordyceps fumosorosea ARSEF 2679]|uniref:HET domain protein n=1 Tax=Cordyceps fumosorosea (strain ARSEF 2679) TaxID=1081104 RepID=A0A167TQU4_CORFA|nr:HET domain protein [Cordyceps fumosorosea ARSEF 2679]OAA60851.1 HET domain protein [Cordyceps fumosorosea ARSEF 2679]